ncbi:1-aminocyclopropane-1-carboxylate deaminase/D-cysteine desulfhydrase [Saccharospirillum salsuginis]|uniref:1-aminocyclopropane-1-carboxylate deaminase n=1 Tax=Saccharospirillum salsuginis TaxID=418750 RepID=A0A918NEV9_9GAMM|nr:pyridoxal-phosphate dependent enzyme [Saccharospirillum salsuginis]GGX62010.1 1-aminocyclopropane-1-carboxylate deaminase [Saccharospirillum salsuginis]
MKSWPDPVRLDVDRTPWNDCETIFTVRGDRLHPVVSGNKWFKLLPLLEFARLRGIQTLVSVGGPYSNHLHALAYAGHRWGFDTVGIVRGPEPDEYSQTLQDCLAWGMTLRFISRTDYAERYSTRFEEQWRAEYPGGHFIAEGGWSPEAIQGSANWWQLAGRDLDWLVCPVGSGTTLAGLILSAPTRCRVVGVPVYRDPDEYTDLRRKLAEQGISADRYRIWSGHAGRGFGRSSEAERTFGERFEARNGYELDPVYTRKTFLALASRLNRDPSLKDSRIGVLHTGGLQGRTG